MSAHPRSRARAFGGFSLVELLLVLVLGAVLIVALQTSLVRQRRLYETQRAISERNETLRFAAAVFGSAMREAVLPDGDLDVLASNRVRARVPHGIGIVCGTDNNGSRIGVVAPQGYWGANPGDSVWLQRADVWTVDEIQRIDAPSNRVPCTQVAGGLILRLDQDAPDANLTSPARSFRSQVFESAAQAGSWWLFRDDGAVRDLLLGPLDPVQGFLVRYEDAAGGPVATVALADRVAVRVIAMPPPITAQPLTRVDTLTLEFGRRNR